MRFGSDFAQEIMNNQAFFTNMQSQNCPPDRIYYYLKTLNDIVDYIVNHPTEIIKLTSLFKCRDKKYCSTCATTGYLIWILARLFGCKCSCESGGT
jgi:hypothetical protein